MYKKHPVYYIYQNVSSVSSQCFSGRCVIESGQLGYSDPGAWLDKKGVREKTNKTRAIWKDITGSILNKSAILKFCL